MVVFIFSIGRAVYPETIHIARIFYTRSASDNGYYVTIEREFGGFLPALTARA
jgi:hypothetical protein